MANSATHDFSPTLAVISITDFEGKPSLSD